MTAPHPLLLLADIERRSKAHAFALPQQVEVRPTWDGIAFRLGGMQLIAAMDEVKELLPVPRITVVPGAKRWVRGVANVRGTLLPVMDLHGFLFGELGTPGRRSRLLVARHEGLAAGLVVDDVLGLRHFFAEEWTQDTGENAAAMAPYLRGAYRRGDEAWAVFSLQALVASREFIQVAA